jgi:hypothetical protein
MNMPAETDGKAAELQPVRTKFGVGKQKRGFFGLNNTNNTGKSGVLGLTRKEAEDN